MESTIRSSLFVNLDRALLSIFEFRLQLGLWDILSEVAVERGMPAKRRENGIFNSKSAEYTMEFRSASPLPVTASPCLSYSISNFRAV